MDIERFTGTQPAGASILCLLFGTTELIADDELHMLYPTHGAFVSAYGKATQAPAQGRRPVEARRKADPPLGGEVRRRGAVAAGYSVGPRARLSGIRFPSWPRGELDATALRYKVETEAA